MDDQKLHLFGGEKNQSACKDLLHFFCYFIGQPAALQKEGATSQLEQP
jgi:hypothetical protein